MTLQGMIPTNPFAEDKNTVSTTSMKAEITEEVASYIQHRERHGNTDSLKEDLKWIQTLERHLVSQKRTISSATPTDISLFLTQYGPEMSDMDSVINMLTEYGTILKYMGLVNNNPFVVLSNLLIQGTQNVKLALIPAGLSESGTTEQITSKTGSSIILPPSSDIPSNSIPPVISNTNPACVDGYGLGLLSHTTTRMYNVFMIAIPIIFICGFLYVLLGGTIDWQTSTDVSSDGLGNKQKEVENPLTTGHNDKFGKSSDKKTRNPTSVFYQKDMKNYYCRDYLKTTCNSSSLLENPLPVNQDNLNEGGKRYFDYCSRCHGESGKGNGPDAVHLGGSLDRLGWSGSGILEKNSFLFWIIADGGTKFDGKMPQFKGILSEKEIWQVMLFLSTLR